MSYFFVIQMLLDMQFFTSLRSSQLEKIVDAFRERTYHAHDYIVRQGEVGDSFFVIFSGRTKVTQSFEEIQDNRLSGKTVVTVEKTLRHLGPGEFFGEKALLDSNKGLRGNEGLRTANVVCEENVTCLVLNKEIFVKLVGPQFRYTTKPNAGGRSASDYVQRRSALSTPGAVCKTIFIFFVFNPADIAFNLTVQRKN